MPYIRVLLVLKCFRCRRGRVRSSGPLILYQSCHARLRWAEQGGRSDTLSCQPLREEGFSEEKERHALAQEGPG